MAFNYDWQQAAYLHPNQHCQFGAVVNFFLCDRISCDNRYYETIDGKTADITDEIPFDLPDSWAWCRLGILCQKIGAGKTPLGGKSQYVTSGIPLIREQNVYNNGLSYDGMAFITKETNQSMKGSQVFAKDLLMNITGGSIGRTALIIDDFSGGNVNQHVLIIRLINSSLRHFIHRALHSDFILGLMFSKQTGDKPGLSAEKVNRFLIPLPPLAEQKRIVEQIETLLGYVDIIDTDAETLEKSITLAKQKILDLAIRGKLVPQDPTDEPASELLKKIKAEKEALVKAGKIKKDKHESFIFKGDDNCYHENIVGKVTDITDEILFDLPVGWEWCRLATISEFDLGKTLDRQKNTGNYRKYLRSVNVLWGNIDLADVKEMRFEDTELERYSIKKGDLLICEGGDVGRCAVWDKDFVFYYQNALHRVRFYQKCVPLFYQFVMMFFENTGLLKEISQGVTIKHLTKNTLNSMFFPLPPLAEQKRIVSQIEKLFAVLETMRG